MAKTLKVIFRAVAIRMLSSKEMSCATPSEIKRQRA